MLDRFPELKVAYELKEYYINMNSTTLLSDAPESYLSAVVLPNMMNYTDCSITGVRK